MQGNIHSIDRFFRMFIATWFLALFVFGFVSGVWGGILCFVAALLLASAVSGSCLFYKIIGFSTLPIVNKTKEKTKKVSTTVKPQVAKKKPTATKKKSTVVQKNKTKTVKKPIAKKNTTKKAAPKKSKKAA